MKKLNILIISMLIGFLNLSTKVLGQHINTGIWNSSDYHFNFNPDTNIIKPSINNTNTLEIDINGDGTNDFVFSSFYRQLSAWYWEERLTIENLNQNQIAFSVIDSCMSNDPIPLFVYRTFSVDEFNYNSLIDSNLNWTDSLVNISYSDFDVNFPTNWGFSCYRLSQFQTDTGYIAVRLIEPNDTLYGWIKISNVDVSSCVIHELACNTIISEVNNVNELTKCNIFPNPTTGKISIDNQVGNTDYALEIYDIYGKEVLKTEVGSKKITVDLSNQPKGIYIIKAIIDKQTITRKLIKQ